MLIQQTWSALYMLENLIKRQKFDLIVELGTNKEGLSKFFCVHNCNYVGYDIKYGAGNDIYSKEVQDEVRGYIEESRKAMIFCDAGRNRVGPIREYSKLLRVGDFILAHDYGRSQWWNYYVPESFLDELPGLGLDTYRQDEFDRMLTFILCMRKVLLKD